MEAMTYTDSDKAAIRILVRAREDFQDQRKRMDNRIGRKADGKDQSIDERPFRPDDLESFVIVSESARQQEKEIEKRLKKALKRFSIYNEYLLGVKGVGTIAAAQIIGELDIHKATTVSKMWQYCGMNPSLIRGKKRKNNPDGSFDIITTDEMIRGDKLTAGFVSPFNKRIKTALLGVLADGFIKAGLRYKTVDENEYNKTSDTYRRIKDKDHQIVDEVLVKYVDMYLAYKHRLANSNQIVSENKGGGKVVEIPWKEATPSHRDRAAKRYMIKMFLTDLYAAWREIEGLPVRAPYQEEYLGHKHES